MIDRHMRDLRLDRRLQRRRGWISAQDMDEVLQGLPDVAAKGELVTEEAGETVAEATPAAEAAPAAPGPAEGF